MVALAKFLALVGLSCSALVAALPTAQSFDYSFGRDDVSVVRSTHATITETCYHGMCTRTSNFTVGIAVRNKAFEKQVGIKWSGDDWFTSAEVPAHYVGNLNNEFELWEVTAGPFTWMNHLPEQYPDPAFTAYASFANGARAWDAYPNYNNQKKYVLRGSVRTFAFDTNVDTQIDKIKVRWTIDNWKTSQDSPAQLYEATKHKFNFDVVVADAAAQYPETLSFAIGYTSTKGTFWTNNDGNNHLQYFPAPPGW
ncbi:hypothetical protein DFJ77DRAFT_749 [Powellomyces hirtus]|nr:hypothetical protein DFJ77DRAFT_749 [Powellomyces hirtus]